MGGYTKFSWLMIIMSKKKKKDLERKGWFWDKTIRRDTKMERLALQAGIALGLAWPHQCRGWRVSVSCFDENCMCSQSVTSCDAVKKPHKTTLDSCNAFFRASNAVILTHIRCHTSSVNANSSPGNSFDSIPSELRGVRQAAHHQTPALEAPIQSTGSAGLRKLVEAHLSPTPPKKQGLKVDGGCDTANTIVFFFCGDGGAALCVCVCSLVIDSWYEYSRSMPQLCDLHRWLGCKNWNISKKGWSPLPHT